MVTPNQQTVQLPLYTACTVGKNLSRIYISEATFRVQTLNYKSRARRHEIQKNNNIEERSKIKYAEG